MSALILGAKWHARQQSSAFYRVPTEIWREIFQCATAIPGKDEFSSDGVAYDILPREETTFSAILTRSELSGILGIRLSIIQVCKYWYDVAIELLWSHLRLDMGGEEALIHRIIHSLEETPNLCRWVARLTLQGVQPFQFGEPTFRATSLLTKESLIPKLCNLRIVTCYQLTLIPDFPPSVTKVVLSIFRIETPEMMLSMSSWEKISSLHLEISGIDSSRPEKVTRLSFPQLKYLFISSWHEWLIWVVTELWDTPILENLSLSSRAGVKWAKFIRRNRNTLKQLELAVVKNWPPVDIPTIQIPSLSSFSVACNCIHWVHIIQAPVVSQVILFDVDFISTFRYTREEVFANVQSIISTYPSMKTLRMYEEGPFVSPTTKVGLTGEDLAELRAGGIKFEIRGIGQWRRAQYVEEPTYTLAKLFKNHPLLENYRYDTIFPCKVIRGPSSTVKQWQAYFNLAGFKEHGGVFEGEDEAQDSAAELFLRMIRERELVNSP